MPTLLILMIIGGLGFVLWDTGRAAAERAMVLGRNACRVADVQWLDHSVHATGLRLRRLPSGWLGFERSFRFDYSYDGIERHTGRMVLLGRELVSFTGPSAAQISKIRPASEEAEDI